MRVSTFAVCAALLVATASASLIWNDFSTPFHDDFTAYNSGDFPNPRDWAVDLRDWGLVGKDHYPYLSDNDPTDRRCYENNGVSPANVFFRSNTNVTYLPRLKIPPQIKTVMVLRAYGDNTPTGQGYPAGIKKVFKIDAYRDTSSFFGRWILSPDNPQRVGSTVQTNYYFGPGSFEVGMKPLQDFGATTTIWAYHYNEFYPETPDPLQRYATTTYDDPKFDLNCYINPGDTAENPGLNCSCPLNSFPPHPWQQQQMGEFDHWWASNSEIDIEFPTPASNADLSTGMANMMRFNTWKGQCGVQYTYSFQVIKTLDSKGNIVNMTADPGFHDGYFHVWRFDWYNNPQPQYGNTRIEFYIDGILQRNVSWMNPTDPEPRVRQAEWQFLELMPDRPMRLWIGVWFSYWGTASPANCLTPDDTTDPFSRPCAPWGNSADPENPADPVWREALIDYVTITPQQGWGNALWYPELYSTDGIGLTEYPYAMPYASVNSGLLPPQSSTGLTEDFSGSSIDTIKWQVSQSNLSPRLQTVWGQMCHDNICKGSLQDIQGTIVRQTGGGFNAQNVVPNAAASQLELVLQGDLHNGDFGHDEIGGIRSDGRKVGAMVRTAQYFGPGQYNIKVAFAGAGGAGPSHKIFLTAASDWLETSDEYAAHCASASSLPTTSDCRTNCLNPVGWPKGTGFWLQKDSISLELPYHPLSNNNSDAYSYNYAKISHSIGVCQSGTGLGSNGTAIAPNSPEFVDYTIPNAITGNPFNNGDGSRRFVDVGIEWHTWLNASCPRHIKFTIDGATIFETPCDSNTQGLIPVSALRLYVAASVEEKTGLPFWDTQTTLLDSVTITQFDEPVDRYIESFPYTDIAEPEQLQGYKAQLVSPSKLTKDSVSELMRRL